jgi:hypothetical protein
MLSAVQSRHATRCAVAAPCTGHRAAPTAPRGTRGVHGIKHYVILLVFAIDVSIDNFAIVSFVFRLWTGRGKTKNDRRFDLLFADLD